MFVHDFSTFSPVIVLRFISTFIMFLLILTHFTYFNSFLLISTHFYLLQLISTYFSTTTTYLNLFFYLSLLISTYDFTYFSTYSLFVFTYSFHWNSSNIIVILGFSCLYLGSLHPRIFLV